MERRNGIFYHDIHERCDCSADSLGWHCSFFTTIWTGIQTVFSAVVEFFSGIFSGAVTAIQSAWSGVTAFFSSIWAGIQSIFSVVASVLGGFFGSAVSAIQSAWSGVTAFFSSIWSGIQSIFSVVSSVLGGFLVRLYLRYSQRGQALPVSSPVSGKISRVCFLVHLMHL